MREIIEAIKSKKLREVFFGSNGFNIADEENINDFQLGYSVDSDGGDISGSHEGDWQKNWIVIGTDTEVGDPFFVDTSEASLPVYTAMHGMGEWSAELVSNSLVSFLDALSYLNDISKQDFARIDPDENTVTDPKELAAIERKLQDISGEKYYWQNFIEQHQEWVDEFSS
ncbi:hypothetical protein K0I63_13475 [Shewanella rhizosphaerae]|uniref:hypothetical protein n=1 Tax=Shewanella rhizosphaerae TaxID=2864207 RepID=UPI001C65CAD8|nr:hypothetical protein [Shewanella rhizosphaerae]QYK11774.1 hypothetical protein K0I63_13475 [Shewanella rhizosphaerae]